MTDAAITSLPTERSLPIVEDDKSFLQRLARAMEGQGFTVTTAESVGEGLLQVEQAAPAFAVVDMRLGKGNGLYVISAIKKRRPEARAIILTGYGNITSAVNAVKLGAVDYLAKPVKADDVAAALLALDNKKNQAAGKSHDGSSGALGAYSAHLRIMRPQHFGNRSTTALAASTVDPFAMMTGAKDLPTSHYDDYSLVFID